MRARQRLHVFGQTRPSSALPAFAAACTATDAAFGPSRACNSVDAARRDAPPSSSASRDRLLLGTSIASEKPRRGSLDLHLRPLTTRAAPLAAAPYS